MRGKGSDELQGEPRPGDTPAHRDDPISHAQTSDDLSERREELEKSGFFASIIHKRYLFEREHSAAEYCDLLGTFSDVRGLQERNRKGLLACIYDLIESRFHGRVVRQDVYDLWLAQVVARLSETRGRPVSQPNNGFQGIAGRA